MWDPGQYARFGDERGRPFFDLLARLDGDHQRIADLGCGSAELTRVLLERWPRARVIGVDSSPEMLARARQRVPSDPRLELVQADAARWRPEAAVDLLVSNAMLHWLPDHAAALRHFASLLAPGGTLALQMPANFAAPSHRLLRESAASGPWAGALEGALRHDQIQPPDAYLRQLHALGFEVDAWQTTYLHLLAGDDAVLEWVKGSALVPILSRLDDALGAEFLAAYGARLREAYPRGDHGTLFPFCRLFWVARLRS